MSGEMDLKSWSTSCARRSILTALQVAVSSLRSNKRAWDIHCCSFIPVSCGDMKNSSSPEMLAPEVLRRSGELLIIPRHLCG